MKSLSQSLKKLLKKWNELMSRFFLNSVERRFVALNRSCSAELQDQKKDKEKKEIKVLVQMPEDYIHLILFSSILRSLKRDFNVKIGWISVLTELERRGRFGFLKRSSFYERKWNRLYLSSGGSVDFSNKFYDHQLKQPLLDQVSLLLKSCTSKEALVDLRFMGIQIGDLVYDTYLRFKPAATVDVLDPFLESILTVAVHIVEAANALQHEKHYDFLFTSYFSYTHHGLMVRVFERMNVPVMVFSGSHTEAAFRYALEPREGSKDYSTYPNVFASLGETDKIQALKSAEGALKKRFEGSIDSGTLYMSKSAYHADAQEQVFQETGRKRVVIFLHCFFDSPHLFRSMLYPDFLEWIEATLTIASSTGYDCYVKPHPNGVAGNEEIIDSIRKKFPKIHFLSKKISNLQMIREGFDLAVTVYGTLGHEFPYFGIPVLNAGDNPHAGYDFCVHPATRSEYEAYLRDILSIPKLTEASKRGIFEFYYMHNLHAFPGKLATEDSTLIFEDIRSMRNSSDLDAFLTKYEQPAYQARIDGAIYDSFLDALEKSVSVKREN